MKKKARRNAVVLIEDVPTELKRTFKAACASNEESMREAIIAMMETYIKRKECQ